MANNQKESKVVKYGAGFLVLLLLANFIVRLGRGSGTTPKVNVPSKTVEANTPVKPVSSGPSPALPLSTPANFAVGTVDIQIKSLKDNLEKRKNDLTAIPIPVQSPDFSTSLFLMRQDLFKPSQITVASTTTPIGSATPDFPASISQQLEIIGSFVSLGRKKLLVRQDQKVFLVEENAMDSDAEITLLSYIDSDFTLIDKAGKEFTLKLSEQKDENVDKIVELFRSQPQQPFFNLIRVGTDTKEIQP